MTTEHFIPVSLSELRKTVADGADPAVTAVADRLLRLLHLESAARVERLKDLYAPCDPNAEKRPTAAPATGEEFGRELAALLERANYRRLDDAELQRAFTTESVFKVRLHTDLSDFAELLVFARGRKRRTEQVRTCFGLRRRALDVEYFERVLLMARFHEADRLPERRRSLPVVPGALQLKLFANVPAADLEMLFPNAEVRMKNLDKALIGIPALLGIGGLASKLTLLLAPLYYLAHKMKLHGEAVSMDTGTLAAVLGAAFALYLFINRQVGRYRFRRLQFHKALADSLYVRNLDNNAGAFHRVSDDAVEDECKEAVLAWRFLAEGPQSAESLDARIEAFLKERCGVTADFEVDDALAKLERLGVARREGSTWHALPAATAAQVLAARWQAALATP